MRFRCKEDIIQITQLWKGERFEDGRPKVADSLLKRLSKITIEEAWALMYKAGYKCQFVNGFQMTAPGKVLCGRAVTTAYVPLRPDLHEAYLEEGHKNEGRKGFFNQWLIDSLVEHDVAVVDLMDKIQYGTYVGGNLSTAIKTRTVDGGAVIWGGVRDLDQILEMELPMYIRGNDPTAIADCTMISLNMPVRIGGATCLPGDVVLGTPAGVIFIPAHMAEEVAIDAEKSRVRDIWGFLRLKEGTYTGAQVDAAWSLPMWEDFLNWLATDPQGEEYQHLVWDEELAEAKKNANVDRSAEVRL